MAKAFSLKWKCQSSPKSSQNKIYYQNLSQIALFHHTAVCRITACYIYHPPLWGPYWLSWFCAPGTEFMLLLAGLMTMWLMTRPWALFHLAPYTANGSVVKQEPANYYEWGAETICAESRKSVCFDAEDALKVGFCCTSWLVCVHLPACLPSSN